MRIRLFEQKDLPPTPVLPHDFKHNLVPRECSCYAYCDHCGSELYGTWVYDYCLTYRPQWENALNTAADSQVRERINATLKADILPIREYLSTLTPSLQKSSLSTIIGITFIFPEVFSSVQNDVRAFYKLGKCPVCGMPLEHKKGYFALDYGAKVVLNTILPDSEKRELDERMGSQEYNCELSFSEWLYAEEDYFNDDEKRNLFAERLPGLDITNESDFRVYEELLGKHYSDFCLDDIFNVLRFRRPSGLSMATKVAKEFIDSCAFLLPTDIVSTNADQIRKSPTLLQDYIHHLIKLDTEIYSASQYLPQLYKQRSIIDRKVTGEHRTRQYELNSQHEELLEQIQDIKKKISDLSTQPVTVQVSDTDLPFVKPIPPSAPTAPVYKTPGFFNKKATEQHNDALRRQFEMETQAYQAALVAYNAEMSRYAEVRQQIYDEKLEKAQLAAQAETDAAKLRLKELQISETDFLTRSAALEQQPIASKGLKNMIDKEIADFEAMIKKLFETRNALYNCNIVFGKYRNIVALSTFYEYLMAGRCESLEGAAGAYNLYESECRANQIIGQLDKVINSLEEIKDAQYMIYSQLQTANHQLDRMQTSLNKAVTHLENISENTDVIAHNTAINAYYAKVNAELTDSLGFMMALN